MTFGTYNILFTQENMHTRVPQVHRLIDTFSVMICFPDLKNRLEDFLMLVFKLKPQKIAIFNKKGFAALDCLHEFNEIFHA